MATTYACPGAVPKQGKKAKLQRMEPACCSIKGCNSSPTCVYMQLQKDNTRGRTDNVNPIQEKFRQVATDGTGEQQGDLLR